MGGIITNNNHLFKTRIIACAIAAVLLIVFTVLYLIKSQDTRPHGTDSTSSPSPSAVISKAESPSGQDMIVSSIDLDSAVISLLPLHSDEAVRLGYTGGTDIRTKYNRPIPASLLKKGDIVTVSYESDRLISLKGHPEVKIHKNITAPQIDTVNSKITFGNSLYRFDNSLQILSDDENLTLDSLSSLDLLNFYCIDDYVYVIRIANGHGHLKLVNYSSFVGGTLTVGHGRTYPITEDFELELAEGEYAVTVEKDEISASSVIKISNGLISSYDLADYIIPATAYGLVSFRLYPEEADLYIDGRLVTDTQSVSLSYGEHTVEAVLGGYTPYLGSLNVNFSGSEQIINLSKSEPVSEVDEDLIYSEGNDDISSSSPDNGSGAVTDADNIPDTTTDKSDYNSIPIVDGDSDSSLSGNNDTASDTGGSDGSDPAGDNSSGSGNNKGSDPEDGNSSGSGNNKGSDPADGNFSGSGDNKGSDPADGNSSGSNNSNSSDTAGDNSSGSGDSDGSPVNIKIFCSTGVKVYINDRYLGETTAAGISCKCAPGTASIRLERDGYITKKYTVTVDSDGEDCEFRFPDLTKSS